MNPRFYFFLRAQGAPEEAGYQHCLVALAEGLRSLGLPFGANRDYWKEEGGWLFRGDTALRPEDCDVLVTSDEYSLSGGVVPAGLLGGGRRSVFVDASDGWRTKAEAPEYRRFDLVLRTHCNRHYRYPGNVRPWAFGLTERIVAACGGDGGNAPGFSERAPKALVNFRVGHPVRRAAEAFAPPALAERLEIDRSLDEPPGEGRDRELWEATGRRHYPSFYARLGASRACAAFGGYFAPGIFRSTEAPAERALLPPSGGSGGERGRSCSSTAGASGNRSARAASPSTSIWRPTAAPFPSIPAPASTTWASTSTAPTAPPCCAKLPTGNSAAIAAAGRSWALEHYSPKAAALRLLDLLGLGQ